MPRMGKLARAALVSSIVWVGVTSAATDTSISTVLAAPQATSTGTALGNISFSAAGQILAATGITIDGTLPYTISVSPTTSTPQISTTGNAIIMTNARTSGTTTITVAASASVTSSGAAGISADASGSGTFAVSNSGAITGSTYGANITGSSSAGASIVNNSGGAISGNTAGINFGGGTSNGVYTLTNAGNVGNTTTNAIGLNITNTSTLGASIINNASGNIAGTTTGFNITNTTGAVTLTNNTGATIEGATQGILATTGAGLLSITNGGTIKGASTGANSAISIPSLSVGGLSFTNSSGGVVTPGTGIGHGISVTTAANAPITMNNAGSITGGTSGNGMTITAPIASTGAISLTNSGTITGGLAGINFPSQWSVAGLTIANTGTITGNTTQGINLVSATATGAVSVNNGGTIKSLAANAVDVGMITTAGAMTFSTAGNVEGALKGINISAVSNTATALNMTISAGTVKGNNGEGILVSPATGTGAINITNAGTVSGINAAAININSGGAGPALTTLTNNSILTASLGDGLRINTNTGAILNSATGQIVGAGAASHGININSVGSTLLSLTNNTGGIIASGLGNALNIPNATTITTLTQEGSILQTGATLDNTTAAFKLGGVLGSGAAFTNKGTIKSLTNSAILFTANGQIPLGFVNDTNGVIETSNPGAASAIDWQNATTQTTLTNKGSIIGNIVFPAGAVATSYTQTSTGTVTGNITTGTGASTYNIGGGRIIGNITDGGGANVMNITAPFTTEGNITGLTVLNLSNAGTVLTVGSGKQISSTGNIAVTAAASSGITLKEASVLDIKNGAFTWTTSSPFVVTIGSGTSTNPEINLNMGQLKGGAVSTIDFLGTGNFSVALGSSAYIGNGAVFRVINTTGVLTAPVSPVFPNSIIYSFTGSTDANGYLVTVARTNLDAVAATQGPGSGVANAVAVAKTLEEMASAVTPNPGIAAIVASLSNTKTAADLVRQLQEYGPVANNDLATTTLAAITQSESIVVRRLETSRVRQGEIRSIYSAGSKSRYAAGTGYQRSGTWVQLFNSWAKQNERELIEGYYGSTTGVGLGNDWLIIDDQCRIGVGGSYSLSKVGRAESSSKLQTITYSGIVYGSFGEPEGWYVDALGSVSHSIHRSYRRITGPFITSNLARAWFRGYQMGGRMGFGYTYKYFDVSVIPTMSVAYTNLFNKGYTERDGGAANMVVTPNRMNTFVWSAGGRIRWENDLVDGKFIPEFRAGLTHNFSSDRYQSTAQFVSSTTGNPIGSPFVINGAGIRKTGLTAGFALNYIRSFGQLVVSYDIEKKSDFALHTANIQYKYLW